MDANAEYKKFFKVTRQYISLKIMDFSCTDATLNLQTGTIQLLSVLIFKLNDQVLQPSRATIHNYCRNNFKSLKKTPRKAGRMCEAKLYVSQSHLPIYSL